MVAVFNPSFCLLFALIIGCNLTYYFIWIVQSFLDVAIEMEKQQRLGEEKLDELYDVLEKCDKQLASSIDEFKNTNRGYWWNQINYTILLFSFIQTYNSFFSFCLIGGRLPLQEVFPNERPRLPIVSKQNLCLKMHNFHIV